MATLAACPRTAYFFGRMALLQHRFVRQIASVASVTANGCRFMDNLWRKIRDDRGEPECGRGSRRLFFAGNRFEAVVIRDEQTAPAHALDEALAHEAGDVARDGLRAQADGTCDVI